MTLEKDRLWYKRIKCRYRSSSFNLLMMKMKMKLIFFTNFNAWKSEDEWLGKDKNSI